MKYNSNIKKLLRWIMNIFQFPFHDIHIDTASNPYHSIYEKICLSWRYRFARFGVLLTANEHLLSSYRNKYLGERCFIIGNGPSLNDIDLSLLKQEYTFGVNAIYLNKSKMGFFPTFHVVEDTLVAEDRANELLNYKGSIKFIGNHLKYCLGQGTDFIWLNTMFDYSEYRNFPKFSTNALRRLWVGGTVSYLCMQLAYYMGFKEVYLVGFDHSYVIPDDVDIVNKTFTSNSEDVNHFNSSYFGKGKRWHDPALWRMEMAYRKAKKAFRDDNRNIINATHGGKLEIFERKSFNKIFD
jgi:hypothetical protein